MTKASENVFPKVQFSEETAPATPAAGEAVVYVKADGKLYLKDDGGTETDLTSGGGGGDTVKGSLKYLRERLASETGHADDDFFTSDTSGDYTTQTVSGTATWTLDPNHNLLSVKFDDQSAGDTAAYLKALTSVSAPITLETSLRMLPNGAMASGDFALAGLALADGTLASSNCVLAEIGHSGVSGNMQLTIRVGTLTNNTVSFQQPTTDLIQREHFDRLYLRLVWINTTTVTMNVSIDGVTWTDVGAADFTISSFTPTHGGFWVSTIGGNDESYASFDYLRRNNANQGV